MNNPIVTALLAGSLTGVGAFYCSKLYKSLKKSYDEELISLTFPLFIYPLHYVIDTLPNHSRIGLFGLTTITTFQTMKSIERYFDPSKAYKDNSSNQNDNCTT